MDTKKFKIYKIKRIKNENVQYVKRNKVKLIRMPRKYASGQNTAQSNTDYSCISCISIQNLPALRKRKDIFLHRWKTENTAVAIYMGIGEASTCSSKLSSSPARNDEEGAVCSREGVSNFLVY